MKKIAPKATQTKKPATKKPAAVKKAQKVAPKPSSTETQIRQPRLPWLHRKRYYLPLLGGALAAIIVLLALPLLPQAQSVAQDVTTNHPAVAKVAPPSFKPPDVSLPTTGSWLIIPESGIKLPIVEGSSISVLNKQVGVWHQTGDNLHNYVIAGHRLQYYRTVNQSLYHLDRLQVGDTGVYVVMNGVAQQYQVQTVNIVDKHDVAILNPTATPTLTIYTCNDFFNQRRLTVTATPV